MIITAVLAGAFTMITGCDSTAAPAPVATGTASPVRVAGLFALRSRTLGPIVVDGQGYVLYRSDRDSPAPSHSTCVDACTRRWLPAPATPGMRVVGIDRQLVGTLTRPDGTLQLTLAGWPLYGFAGDRMPGDTNGQGADETWSLITPDGGKAGRVPGQAG